jgi:hypothetical protein
LLGFAQPKRFWQCGLLVGVWLPLVHLAGHALGRSTGIHPATYLSIVPLIPVSLVTSSISACGGWGVRKVFSS